MKTLGVIGGLGPMATAYLLRLIIEMTDAKTDQEHLDALVFNRPKVPDRTAYILDREKPSPLPPMIETARQLERLGAGVLCTPCVTAHFFHRELRESVSVPFLNMVEETAGELAAAGKKRPGVMATTGTVTTGLFQSAFAELGMEAVLPSEEGQAKVMGLIYDDVKAGREPDMGKLRAVERELAGAGCDCVVLGCTELSILKRDNDLSGPGGAWFLDALEVLAKRCVLSCGGKLKERYEKLV